MKTKHTEEDLMNDNRSSFVASFAHSEINLRLNSPVKVYRQNTNKNKSRSDSIADSHENSIESKSFVNNMHSQNSNINSLINNFQNYTKTSRVFNKNTLETEGNNTNTITLRYAPTNSNQTGNNGFNMVRSKNSKQRFISDNKALKNDPSNKSLEEINKMNYPLKEAHSDNKDYIRKSNFYF
jgi:hypothetical protein